MSWYVYIVRCRDRTLYTGMTTDLERRMHEHNGAGGAAARYTRARAPVTLVYWEGHATRRTAAQREYQIKRLRKSEKERLIAAAGDGRPV